MISSYITGQSAGRAALQAVVASLAEFLTLTFR
ncbi:hypothetical protein CGLAMM_07760 [Acetobacteraceae bacterium EV16G]|uniref:Uncharacterized protein n=1 Tax=Sorlinia euscelidii TaxID=3081148 RepID=A0ABU7U257_9PROT